VNDPWARPADGREYVEIELVETGSPGGRDRSGAPTGGDDPPPRPGRAGWVVGAALAIAVGGGAAVLSGDDTESATTATTMFDTSQVTTPPTLPNLVTVPPATLPMEPAPATDDAGGAETSDGDRAWLDPASVTVPEFAVIPDVGPPAVGAFELLPAVALNAVGDLPKRTTVLLDGVQLDGLYSSAARLVVESDPASERDSLTVEWGVGAPAEFVVDRASDAVYRTDARLEGRWERFTSAQFTDGTGAADLGDLFDTFVTGPISPRTLAASTITTTDELVELEAGILARAYTVITPIEALVPYGVLLLANVYDDSVTAGRAPREITFIVYVTEGSELALVTARFEANATAFALQQTFGPPPSGLTIALPPLDVMIPEVPQPSP
jgi:hypothetical protein